MSKVVTLQSLMESEQPPVPMSQFNQVLDRFEMMMNEANEANIQDKSTIALGEEVKQKMFDKLKTQDTKIQKLIVQNKFLREKRVRKLAKPEDIKKTLDQMQQMYDRNHDDNKDKIRDAIERKRKREYARWFKE
jgi:hypothetical protein